MTKLGDWVAIAAIGSIVALVIGGYRHLNQEHANRAETESTLIEVKRNLLETEVDLRQEIVDRDVKKDAESRAHYKSLEQNRSLEPAEKARIDYLEEQMEQKYDEQRSLREAKMRLKEK
jgi:hypothetical protein